MPLFRGIEIENIELYINPELVAAAFKKSEIESYVIWLTLKALDRKFGNSNHFDFDFVYNWIQGIFYYDNGRTRVYKMIKNGESKFWTPFKGKRGNRSASLYSFDKVINYLQPTMARTKPFIVTLGDLLSGTEEYNGLKRIKDFLIAIIASRNNGEKPTSYATIEQQTGLSNSTIRRAVKLCNNIIKIKSYTCILSNKNFDVVKIKLNELIELGNRNIYRIIFSGNQYHLVKQIPNVYIMPQFQRGHFKQRPKSLRKFDSKNAADCVNIDMYNTKKLMAFNRYTFEDMKKISDKEQITLWK